MTYLLDSNVWITALREPGPSLVMRFQATDPARVRVCSVVVAECETGRQPRGCRCPAFSVPKSAVRRRRGRTLCHDSSASGIRRPDRRATDLQIAAIAMANGCILVRRGAGDNLPVAQDGTVASSATRIRLS